MDTYTPGLYDLALAFPSGLTSCALQAPDVFYENPILIHSFSLHPQYLCTCCSLCLEPFPPLHLSASSFFRIPLRFHILLEAFLAHTPALQSGQLDATAGTPISPCFPPSGHRLPCVITMSLSAYIGIGPFISGITGPTQGLAAREPEWTVTSSLHLW